MKSRRAADKARAVLAVPGDLNALTGGYLFDKLLLQAMNKAGHAISHLALPGSFPRPTRADTGESRKLLLGLLPDVPIIIDGLAAGAIDTSVLRDLRAPFISLTHHPLAYETNLSDADVSHFKAIERANLALAAHVIVTSPYTAKLLVSDYDVDPRRITIALPSLPTRILERQRTGGTVEILSVGLIAPRKGHDVLLNALAEVSDLEWSANIVGRMQDPAYADRLVAQQERLGLRSRVRFTGEIANEHLSSYFARASVFALASRFEGYGIAFSEALAAGVPVVGCASGAVPSTVPKDAGLLVPPDDPVAFGKALRHLLENADIRSKMSEAARRHALSLPNWEDTAQVVADVVGLVGQKRVGN